MAKKCTCSNLSCGAKLLNCSKNIASWVCLQLVVVFHFFFCYLLYFPLLSFAQVTLAADSRKEQEKRVTQRENEKLLHIRGNTRGVCRGQQVLMQVAASRLFAHLLLTKGREGGREGGNEKRKRHSPDTNRKNSLGSAAASAEAQQQSLCGLRLRDTTRTFIKKTVIVFCPSQCISVSVYLCLCVCILYL